jgi:hypothetical protein
MSKIIRPVVVALALLGTVSAVSAAPKHAPADGAAEHSLTQVLDFWKQFAD